MRQKTRRWAFAALLAVAIPVAGTGVAIAATPPTATTAAASNVTSTTATLNGTVSPNKNTTTYYFQYGTGTAYGKVTPSGTANGNASKSVSANVTGLTAATTYHYRTVATSSGGTAYGVRETFKTAASGSGGGGGSGGPSTNSVTIAATPKAVTFGRAAKISGQVTGPKSNNQTVTLESTAYPYNKPFKPTGLTAKTSSTGTYTFTVTPGLNTRYEVVAATKTPATSPATTVGVRVKVAFHLSTLKPLKGQLVRFYGTVAPAHNGKVAQIQRHTSTGWKTVATTTLVAGGKVNGVAISKYSKRLRLFHSGTYRVRVNPHDGKYMTGNSATRTEHVH